MCDGCEQPPPPPHNLHSPHCCLCFLKREITVVSRNSCGMDSSSQILIIQLIITLWNACNAEGPAALNSSAGKLSAPAAFPPLVLLTASETSFSVGGRSSSVNVSLCGIWSSTAGQLRRVRCEGWKSIPSTGE